MKAFCITLFGHEYSERVADRCIRTAKEVGKIEVAAFPAVHARDAQKVMQAGGLRWTWGGKCAVTGLRQEGYGGDLNARIGCAMSHYLLWKACIERDEPILILEHDAVFLRELPEVPFRSICMINDPRGATKRGAWWSDEMAKRGPGVHQKTHVLPDDVPDGLAGNSAYLIRPWAAARLVRLYETLGVWPNDATMCRQLVPGLEELFPFVTKVEQSRSTTCGQ